MCISSYDANAESKRAPDLRCAACEVYYGNKNARVVLTKQIQLSSMSSFIYMYCRSKTRHAGNQKRLN